MKQYEVIIFEVVRHSTTVEASNRDEAYSKAYEVITNGTQDQYETEAEGFTGDWNAYELFTY
jgi:hypothetical protein